MNRRRIGLFVLFVSAVFSAAAPAQDGRSDAVSFDDWRSLSQQARSEVFVLFSPPKRAEIVGAHLKAWRDEHQAKLSAVQLELIEEAIHVVTPIRYDGDSTVRQNFRGFERDFLARAKPAFLDEEIAELFYLQFEPKPRK